MEQAMAGIRSEASPRTTTTSSSSPAAAVTGRAGTVIRWARYTLLMLAVLCCLPIMRGWTQKAFAAVCLGMYATQAVRDAHQI